MAAAASIPNSAPTSSESSQPEGGESADKPPHEQPPLSSSSSPAVHAHDYVPGSTTNHPHRPNMANIVANNHVTSTGALTPGSVVVPHAPLPAKDSAAVHVEKSPGLTRGSLQTLLAQDNKAHQRSDLASSSTISSGGTFSTPSSPTLSDTDYWGSAPSTRPPSQAPSRTPSMSAGQAGNKLSAAALSKLTKATKSPPGSPQPPAAAVSNSAKPPLGLTSPPVTPHILPVSPPTPSAAPSRGKPSRASSVHSQDGEKHKFNLKDLLGSAPKMSRKGSTKSVKSDNDNKSVAGDSTTSFSAKYGVCAKVAVGKGATSVVRLAHKWDRSEEKLYAVKEFRKRRKNESEKEYVKKLTAEFCISSTLHHVNIVETVDLIQDEAAHWCEVMEFCPGGDLYGAIKKGGMSPSEVECCFKQLLYGVGYLHSQGVAHRDLKPENIFFDGKGHVKIGDYGASTVYRLPWEATIHMSSGLCGSEPYIAPEQFLNNPYDARLVDIWACGIVYYCLHFQELPWRSARDTDNMYSAYTGACAAPSTSACPPTINNLSPRGCRSLLRKMLEPDPEKRADIEECLGHAWVKGIEVCWEEGNEGKHVHVNAKQVSASILRDV